MDSQSVQVIVVKPNKDERCVYQEESYKSFKDIYQTVKVITETS